MPTRVVITIPRNHATGVKIGVEGHAGPGCQKLTEAVQNALGNTVRDEQTEEFGQMTQQTDQTQQQYGG